VVRRGAFAVPVDGSGDPSSASLRAAVVDRAPGASSRLAIYREQVWKRLFVTLQGAFPRTARILGAHRFNRAAMAVLVSDRRASRDLADLTEPFHGALEAALRPRETSARETSARETTERADAITLRAIVAESRAPVAALLDCVRLDEAERRAFRAPVIEPRSAPEGGWDALRGHRATWAPSLSLVRVEHDVVAVERIRQGLGAPLRAPVHVTIVAKSSGVAVRLVDPVFARVLAHASALTLGEALARTRGALDARLAAHLDAKRDDYLRDAFAHGFWTDTVVASSGSTA
jgi:hypothetical protein